MTDNTKPTDTKAPDAKPATPISPIVPAFTKEQLEYIQQVTVATAMAVNGVNAARSNKPEVKSHPECPDCHQYLSACKGKHETMVVYPVRYPEFIAYFSGVKINGVTYISRTPNDKITVPACAVADIGNIINTFEQNEKTATMGRKRDHNAGSLGRRGTGPIHATAAWR